jgi:conjugal transfer ATP-binding protein TraC
MIFGKWQKKQQDTRNESKYTLAGGIPDLRDLAAPEGIRVLDNYAQIGPERYVRAFYISQVPSSVFVGWLDELYNIGDVDVAIHLYPGNNRDVIEELSVKINDLMAMQILDEKRGDYTNASLTKITLEDAWQLREEIQTNRNKMFYVTILFTIAADSIKELDRKSKIAEERLGGRAVHIKQAFLRQDEALKSVSPIGANRIIDVYRNFDLGAATALLPFNCADMAHEGGVFLGINLSTGAPVLYNPFIGKPVLSNPHMALIATSGAGKTTAVKLFTARAAYHGIKTLYIDPEGEYGSMAEELGGINVKLSPEEFGYLNPFDLEPDEDGGKEYVNLKEKVADLKGLISVMIEGSREKMTPEELVIVEDCLFEEYQERDITNDPDSLYERQNILRDGVYTSGYVKKPMPTLSSFYKRLKTKGPKVERLLLLLKPYLKNGSMGLFDGESEINLKNARMINFDISGLEERFLRPFAMHVILSWVWEEFVKGDKESQKIVVVDEAWLSLKYKDTTDFLENMARRARKRKCSLCIATQNFKEFTNIQQGVAILSNIGTKIFMQQNPEEIKDVVTTFKLSDGQKNFLEKAGIGEAIIAAGKQVAAVVFTPTDFEKKYILRWDNEVA